MDRVREWLQSISLLQYGDVFDNNGWDDMDIVLSMTESEVKSVVHKPGHVKKILVSLQRLRDEHQQVTFERESVRNDQMSTNKDCLDTAVSLLNDDALTLSSATAVAAAGNIIEAGIDSVANIILEKGNALECHNSALQHIVATHALSNQSKEQAYIQQTADVKQHMYGGDDLCSGWNNDCQELAVTDSDDSSENDSTSIACIQGGHINTTTTGMAIVAKKGMPMSLTKNTIVKDSKNVTIAKKVQYVTTEVKGTKSNFETQINSSLKTYKNRENLFVKTRAYKDAVDILEDRNWVVVIGNPGDGKSTIAYQLLLDHERKCYDPIIVTSPHDWKKMVGGKSNQSNKQVVLIDDMFGVSNVNDTIVNKWLSLLEVMRNVVSDRKGDLKVVCTNRRSIFNQVVNKVDKFKEFGKLAIVDLTVAPFSLSIDEKATILSTYINHYHISESFSIGKIALVDLNYGFPHCVEIFCTNSIIRKQGADFFRFPLKFVENEIEDYQKSDKRKYCSLLLVLFSDDNAVCLEDLEETSETFCTCLKLAGLSGSNTIYTLNDAFISLENVYLIRQERSYTYKHYSFREIVAMHFAKAFPKYGIKLLDLNFLTSRTRLKECETSKVEVKVQLPESIIPFLAERFTHEILAGNGYRVFTHNCWSDNDFIDCWLQYVTKSRDNKGNLLTICFQQRCTGPFIESTFLASLAIPKLENLLTRILSIKDLHSYFEESALSEHASTALIYAAMHNLSSGILQLLVNVGADVNETFTKFKRLTFFFDPVGTPQTNTTALFYAAKQGNLENVRVLLESGANLFSANQPTYSIIAVAVKDSNIEILEYLLHEIRNRGNYVRYGIKHGYQMLMVKHFLEVGYECFFSQSMINHTVSSNVVEVFTGVSGKVESHHRNEDIAKSSVDIAQIPIECLTKKVIENLHDMNVDFNTTDENGMTILHKFLKFDHTSFISDACLETYFSLLKEIDCNKIDLLGCTAVFYALENSCKLQKQMVDVLLEKSDVTIKNFSKETCLHVLAYSPMHKHLDDYIKVLKKRGVDINDFDSSGNTPIVNSSSFDTMIVFFKNGARLDIENENRANLLMQMLMENYVDIIGKVSFLLENGTDVNGKDMQNKTAVHYLSDSSCKFETKKAVFKLLLKHGCDLHTDPNTLKSILIHVLKNRFCQIQFFDFLMSITASPVVQHASVKTCLLEELAKSKLHADGKLQYVKTFQKYQKIRFGLELYESFLKWEFDTKLSCVQMLSMINISESQVPHLIRLTLTRPISEQSKFLLLKSLWSKVPIDLGNCDDLVEDGDMKLNLLSSPRCVYVLVSQGLKIDSLFVDIGCLRKLKKTEENLLNKLKECTYEYFNENIIGPMSSGVPIESVAQCLINNVKHTAGDAILEEALADQIVNTKKFLDFKDITGITFLSMACRFHSVLLVARLLDAGADPNIRDILGHPSILSLLFSEVAIDIGLWFCGCFGFDMLDELDFVKRNVWPCVSQTDETYLQMCEMLLAKNGNINFDLHSKAIDTININLEILQLLLKHGADPNLVDIYGKTPLHYCAEAPLIDTLICPFMEVLLSHGAKVNAEDFKGRTPLMLCAAYERTKYRRMNILLEAGADIFCEDEDGKVVQDYTFQAACKMQYAMGQSQMRAKKLSRGIYFQLTKYHTNSSSL